MNKTDLIEHIAKHADISKAAATRALESVIGAVKTTLKKGGSVSLVGFGTFAVGKRAARCRRGTAGWLSWIHQVHSGQGCEVESGYESMTKYLAGTAGMPNRFQYDTCSTF